MIPPRDRLKTELGRLIRFGLVGFSALFVYWSVTSSLTSLWHVWPTIAAVVGFISSAFVSYFGHSSFSFKVASNHSAYGPRFMIVTLIGFALNVAGMYVMTRAGVSVSVAALVIGLALPVINYVFNRFWVFPAGLQERAAGIEIR